MLADRQGKKTLDWLLLIGYSAVLFSLLPIRPLWLDEVMELVGSAGVSLQSVVTGYAAHSAGQSPLAACEQALAIKFLGFSIIAARMPAAIAALLAGAGMLVLGKRLHFQHSWLPFAILASFPIVLRYGAEDRPYSQALCIAVWLSVLLMELPKRTILYAALLAVGLYTQPYVLFVALSHEAYLILRKQWALAVRLGAVIAAAVCLYLPWYFYSRAFWRQEVEASQLHFHPQLKLALLIPREMTGAGYAGTAALLVLAVYGVSFLRNRKQDWLPWVLTITLPICSVVLADWLFDYFFAIRQLIVILPALALLAAAGVEQHRARVAIAAALMLFAINAGYAVRWFTKPSENWSAAAQRLGQYTARGACFIPLPSGSGEYYTFFEPAIKGKECGPLSQNSTSVALAISPYLPDRQQEADVRQQLQANGYVLQHSEGGEPQVQLYKRR